MPLKYLLKIYACIYIHTPAVRALVTQYMYVAADAQRLMFFIQYGCQRKLLCAVTSCKRFTKLSAYTEYIKPSKILL